MSVLSESRIVELLAPYLVVPEAIVPQLVAYLDLLVRS